MVLHEVSHLKLSHLRNRLLYSAALVVATTATATFCVFLANLLLPGNEARSFVGFAAAAGAFVLTFRQLGRQSRDHEFEADCHSVEKLGAEVEALISALRKLDRVNGVASAPFDPLSLTGTASHPSTDRRIALLRERFPAKPSEAIPAAEEKRAA